MDTRVDRFVRLCYARPPPPKKTLQKIIKTLKKHRHLRMDTRTGQYLVTYMIMMMMLMMLYDVILKTLKNHAFANAYAYYPPGTLNIFWLLDRVLGPRNLKLS